MQLLLDAHFSQTVSRALREGGADAVTLDEWHDGLYRHRPDHVILEAAAAEARILVTYDNRILSDILIAWATIGRSHAGVVFVNNRTIRQQDVGGLVRALRR